MLTPNVIIIWPSTHASIPTGFSRETSLDDRYPKGADAGSNPAGIGGATTHSHTSATHTHSPVHHTHLAQSENSGVTSDGTGDGSECSVGNHYHECTNTDTNGSTSSAPYTGTSSNDPPYYTVVFIKATTYVSIPNGAIVMKEGTTRTSMVFHAASASKYFKGASTGGDGGASAGGYTNVHSISHTHAGSHGHSGESTNKLGGDNRGTIAGESSTYNWHRHPVTYNANSDTLADASPNSFTKDNNGVNIEPVYRTLNPFVNNTGGGLLLEVGDIAMWLGTIATIPIGWVLCDGNNGTPDMRSKYLKNTASAGASTTGGSNTHTHTATSHSHTVAGTHTHGGGFTDSPHHVNVNVGNSGWRNNPSHSHSMTSCAASAVTYTSTDFTGLSMVSNEPLYETVAYIMFKYFSVGSNMVLD
jgi:hypothetical protein